MASKKKINVEEVEKRIAELSIQDKIVVYKNVGVLIDNEMKGIKANVENHQNICNQWADIRNPKQS